MTDFSRRQARATGIPYWPQTLDSGTVVGRLGSGAGPTEEIPLAVLQKLLVSFQVTQNVVSDNVTVTATDQIIILNKGAGPTTVTLPDVTTFKSPWLEIYDFGSSGPVTINPNGSQKIMGQAAWVIDPPSAGSVRLIPSLTVGAVGWLAR